MAQDSHGDSHSGVIESLDKLYEFEREPVTTDKLQPGKHFAGLLAGEHVAGTEFVIGALFVAWGVRTYDIIVGLLLGNLMAVLTWTLICAPIAVQTRLTLYWYLRRIAGPVTTTIYNILNAVLFCILAGCMITVSASAIRIPFGIPAQIGWLPSNMWFVVIVILMGAMVTALAILGFKRLAQFASVCSPWVFTMFVAGCLVSLAGLVKMTGVGPIASLTDLWNLADNAIWTGKTPDGSEPMSFWQVAAFAWICNLAMHGGLSDMALFRYAKSASYGLYSAFGMYLGHYLAWICAGTMGAAAAMAIKNVSSISEMDAGGVANYVLGVTGIVAVVISGWTTSNPTLYRAGLALQAVTPGWPRWLVTLLAGAATTLIACSPFVFTELLGFVGIYGLLLMPVGAIVLTEHWIFPKIGFTQFWCSRKKLMFSWPALLSWGISMAAALILERTGTIHLFFLFVPVWLLTTVLYILFSSVAGARETFDDELTEQPATAKVPTTEHEPVQEVATKKGDNIIFGSLGIISLAALACCLILAIWVYVAGSEGYDDRFGFFKKWLILPTVIYFVSGTSWAVLREKRKGGF
jgi:purine-cytosine permease-like protein